MQSLRDSNFPHLLQEKAALRQTFAFLDSATDTFVAILGRFNFFYIELIMSGYTLAVIGCGTMGVAVLSGVFDSQRALLAGSANGRPSASGTSTPALADEDLAYLPSRFFACVNRTESGRRLRKTFEGARDVEVVVQGNVRAAQQADVVLLACKPQMVQDIIAEEGMRDALDGKLVISICAGLRIAQMREWVTPNTKVVRAMPNTPCKVSTVSSAPLG